MERIKRMCDVAEARKLPPSRYVFQMLYGVRRDLQRALSADGYRVRVYVPFGREWLGFFMRRLGERPANVAFVIRAMLRDRGAA
jgi:proline dehydrogenase